MTEKLSTKRNSPKWSLWFKGLDEWLLIFQKVSGAILAIYLIGHVLVISTALNFGHPTPLTWEKVIGFIEGPRVVGIAHVGTIIEYLIALLAAVHGANGVRLILMQYFGLGLPRPERHTYPMVPSPRKKPQMIYKYLVIIVVVIFIALASYVAFVG
ncbi:succinate dehydrogenase [Caldivirga maquilingensis]|uniref:Succinate dehydrogenase/fumarate reductase, cytochrome b subunit n=1 Tax=Caldivirga maquilingensis (strain ATCC 700844 / DSM 13496 / JCM 10307 / IC-167) TaxID=397948 RepID=A8M8W3_CALMQ|nr:succinate dehydrogenase [Caldivirga maquilingensis]ABW02182.1 succinate dehydrogenase/fumarate reductase, cytochrome b subunit [Caldivirga maquilingensis IC-167]